MPIPPSAGTLIVRDARVQDQDTLVEFNVRLAAETESRALDRAVLARGVATALADPGRLRYWVAEIDRNVVGQAAATREWSDWRNGWIWWFQSVYVHADARGQGVFRALYQHIRTAALAEADVIGLRLYVEHENRSAQATYRNLGMTPGGYQVFEELWPERFNPRSPG